VDVGRRHDRPADQAGALIDADMRLVTEGGALVLDRPRRVGLCKDLSPH